MTARNLLQLIQGWPDHSQVPVGVIRKELEMPESTQPKRLATELATDHPLRDKVEEATMKMWEFLVTVNLCKDEGTCWRDCLFHG